MNGKLFVSWNFFRHFKNFNFNASLRNLDDPNATVGKKRKGGNAGLDFHDPNKEAKKQSRAARFHKQLRSEPLVLSIGALDLPDGSQESLSWEDCPIVGSCQDITKSYLRLTCAPDPSTVRPVQVSEGSIYCSFCWRKYCFHIHVQPKVIKGV